MAKYFPGLNQLSFDPNSFAGSSQNSGTMKSFNRLSFNIKVGTETKALIMKNFHDIGTRLSYVILSTDDSLDPDKATDLATILEYQLQDNEFLACVELHGRNPALQVGNMHQIFTKNLRSWDFYEATGGDPDPREVRVTFNAAKEPNVVSFTLSSYGSSSGLSSFEWNGTKYSCKYDQLSTTPYLLQLPSLGLKYKHDNTVYTMEDSSYVKVIGKQAINSPKIFNVLPELAVEPTKDSQAVSKGYVDSRFNSFLGKVNTIQLTAYSKADQANLELYHKVYSNSYAHLKIYLSDGRRLDPLFVESNSFSVTHHTKKVVLTLNLQDQENPQPTIKSKEELDNYELKEGEFFATLVSGFQFKDIDNYYFAPRWDADGINPWGEFIPNLQPTFKDEVFIVYRLIVHDIDLKVAKCTISNSGTKGTYYAMEYSDGVLNSSLAEEKNPKNKILIEFDFGSAGSVVDVTSEQNISGAKTFTNGLKSTVAPKDKFDVANKGFIDQCINGDPNLVMTVKMAVTSSWGGLNKLTIELNDGFIEPKFLENTHPSVAKEPVLVVWRYRPASEASKNLERKEKAFFESYQLQEGEYTGTVSYADILGPYKSHTTSSYPYYEPFNQGYLVQGGSLGVQPILKIVITGIERTIKNVHFNNGNDASGTSNPGSSHTMVFERNGQSTTSNDVGTTKIVCTPKDPQILGLGGVVSLMDDQTIMGTKTFKVAPKSSAEPNASDDLVNKGYIDGIIEAMSNSDTSVTGLIKGSNKAGSYCGFSYLKWLLKDGSRLDVKMVENVAGNTATDPVLAVWHVVKDSGAQITAPEKKTKQEIQDYKLQTGEFKGTLSYFKVVGKYNAYTYEPWGSYVGSGLTGQHEGLLGFTIENLTIPFKGIEFTVGNKGESWSYNFDTLQFSGKNQGKSFDINYPNKLSNNQKATVEIPEVVSNIPSFVKIDGAQEIKGVKTFKSLPKCKIAPVKPDDLVNKGYFDSVIGSGFDVAITFKQSLNSTWSGVGSVSIELEEGVLEAKYIEDIHPKDASVPALIVWSIKSAPTTKLIVERKAKDFIEQYELQEGEFFGDISYANILGPYQSHTTSWTDPFSTNKGYLFNGGSGQHPILKVTVKAFTGKIKTISYINGGSANWPGNDCSVEIVVNRIASDTSSTGQGTLADKFVCTPNNKNLFDNQKRAFVSMTEDATVDGAKTFLKPVICAEAPAENTHLTNKKYVDEEIAKLVARIEALEAVKP